MYSLCVFRIRLTMKLCSSWFSTDANTEPWIWHIFCKIVESKHRITCSERRRRAFRITWFRFHIYCGIITIHCESIFVAFVRNSSLQIYIFGETNFKKFEKCYFFVTETHSWNNLPLTKHITHNPQKFATRNLKWFHNNSIKQLFFLALCSNNWSRLIVNSLQKTFDSQAFNFITMLNPFWYTACNDTMYIFFFVKTIYTVILTPFTST